MIRLRQGTAYLLPHVFDDATTVANVTVRVLRDDGTELIPTTSDVTAISATEYGVQLTAEHTGVLDKLAVIWTATLDGNTQTITDTVEIAGGVLFTVAQARAALSDPAYDAAKIIEARSYAESELENALGFALVPRYERRTFSGNGTSTLLLPPYTRAIRWIEVSGTGSGSITYDGGMVLTNPSGWTTGIDNILVALEHGLDVGNDLLPGAKRAALSLAVEYLGGGAGTVDPRAERLITDDGTIVYGSTSGGQFRAAGVNEWVLANRLPVVA